MKEDLITKAVIGAAIEVHRQLGPGLLESVYEEALCHELHLRGIAFQRQVKVPLAYKGIRLAADLRLDLLVAETVIVDLKAKEALSPIDKPQLLTYVRLTGLRVGLIINFHVVALRHGLSRVINDPTARRLPANDDDDDESEIIL